MLSYNENPEIIENKVQQIYNLLKELCGMEDFPAVSHNARRALGVIWQIANDLNLEFEQLFQYKV